MSACGGRARTKLHQTLPEAVGATPAAGAVGQQPPPAWQVQCSSVQHNKETIHKKKKVAQYTSKWHGARPFWLFGTLSHAL